MTTDIECQTDAFLDRPASPLFIPAKTGKDVETQIEEGEVGNPNRSTSPTILNNQNIDLSHILNAMQCNASYYLYPLQLFDFDREVQPVLEVLVGKTIEQSLEEVMEEEELAYLKAQRRAFGERRNNELAEVQWLQEQEMRLNEEKVGT